MLTPMRVETSRMIPVIHAKLFLTSATEASFVLLASSSRLEMCSEEGVSIMDPKDDEDSFADIISPTIFPIYFVVTAKNRLSSVYMLSHIEGIKGALICKR